MANFYLDISAVGNEYEAYAATPVTWAKPQDGNGKAASAASAAVAIGVVDCTSATGSGANTLSVLGVSVANTSTGSGATLAASLVTSINGTATAVGTTYCKAALALNALIHARANPGNSAQVQIMLRIAGGDWNGVSITSSGFTAAPSMTAFAGGVDGPFGYFCNNTAVFGKAQFGYGVFTLAGSGTSTPTVTDLVIARTQRSGVNLTCSLSSATAISLVAIDEFNFVFDDGTTWATDNGQFTLAVSNTSGSVASVIKAKAGAWNVRRYLRFIARKAGGVRFLYTAATAGSTLTVGGNAEGSNMVFQQAVFEDSNANSKLYAMTSGNVVYADMAALDCAFIFKSDHPISLIPGNTYSSRFLIAGGEATYSAVSADPASLVAFTANPSNVIDFEIRHFKATVVGGAWKVTTAFSGLISVTSIVRLTADDVSGLRVVSFPWATTLSALSTLTPSLHFGYWQSRDGDKPFRYSTPYYTTDWVDDGTYPTAGETLPSGNEWSMRTVWQANCHVDHPVVTATVYAFFRGVSGQKTLTLDLLAPNTGAPTQDQIEVVFSYTDSTGVVRNESTAPRLENAVLGSGAALSASAKDWLLNGLAGYSAKKIEIATAYSIGSNTEISAAFAFLGTPSVDTPIFLNPTVGVADA